MLEFGEVQAVATSTFLMVEDVSAWSRTHTAMSSVLSTDAVWRQMLISHFHPAFTYLGGLKETPPPEKLAASLCGETLKEVYAKLQKSSTSCPFVLQPRARLLLEIHELREWDRLRKAFVLQRQAARLAAAFSDVEAVEKLRLEMAPSVLELVSLQTMMNDGRTAATLPQLEEVSWSPSTESELGRLMEKRLQQRRVWLQKQREYLLQGLNPEGHTRFG